MTNPKYTLMKIMTKVSVISFIRIYKYYSIFLSVIWARRPFLLCAPVTLIENSDQFLKLLFERVHTGSRYQGKLV